MRADELALLRALLRCCRAAVRRPVRAVALQGRPTRYFRPASGRAVRAEPAARPLVEDAVRQACGGSAQYAHPSGDVAVAAVRRHWRLVQALGLQAQYVREAQELLSRFEEAADLAGEAELASTVVPVLREARQRARHGTWDKPVATGDLPNFWDDAEESDQKLPDGTYAMPAADDLSWQHLRPIRWPEEPSEKESGEASANDTASLRACSEAADAHDEELPALRRLPPDASSLPEVGEMLLTHPLACLHQVSVDRTVILLDCVDQAQDYARGIVLGVPSASTLRRVLDVADGRGARVASAADRESLSRLSPALLDAPLYWGGDLRERGILSSLFWLHTFDDIPGSVPAAPGLWLGGDLTCLAARAAALPGAPVRPVLGYVGWALSQLLAELERGVWLRCRAESLSAAHAVCLAAGRAPLPGLRGAAVERRPGLPADSWERGLRAAGLGGLADFPRGGQADAVLRNRLGLGASFSLVGLSRMPALLAQQRALANVIMTRPDGDCV